VIRPELAVPGHQMSDMATLRTGGTSSGRLRNRLAGFFHRAVSCTALTGTDAQLTGPRGLNGGFFFTLPLGGIHEIDAPYTHAVREQIQKAELYTQQSGTNPRHQVLTRKHVGRNHCQLKTIR
jgi:hypothetical protein